MIDVLGRGGRWIRDSIESAPAPTLPWANPWQCTLAGILVHRPGSPLLAAGPLSMLDRFGALHLDGGHVGFDGDRHDWSKVTAVRMRNAFELLTTDALEQEVDRIRPLLPPVPGRKKVLTYLTQHLAIVLLAALDQGDDAINHEIVAEIRYRGTLPAGRRVARPSLFPAALLSLRPDINEALVAEALRREIPVTPADAVRRGIPDSQVERVALLRRRTDAIIARIGVDDDGGARV
ncbi:hypothetical protein [Actinospica sp.]|uniref:hypothetical protein n=1 Tax=Actinospica sp. TaxID=1872142 RepID=UPI002CBC41F3|nr:hypothetical protein [Actinospica sp.]HWG27776.1 hypothetical protein [Actinospica sp.]